MGASRATIRFDNDQELEVQQSSLSATLGYQYSTRLGLSASAGAVLGGKVEGEGFRGDVGKGFSMSAALNHLTMLETAKRPFLSTSLSLAFSRTTAESDDGTSQRWVATDLRIGAMVGKTLLDRFVPFASARVFAGPVTWRLGGEKVVGSDVHHYTVGGGMLYQVPGVLSVFAELLPVGERSMSLGASLSF